MNHSRPKIMLSVDSLAPVGIMGVVADFCQPTARFDLKGQYQTNMTPLCSTTNGRCKMSKWVMNVLLGALADVHCYPDCDRNRDLPCGR
jgi:hypothetical protein